MGAKFDQVKLPVNLYNCGNNRLVRCRSLVDAEKISNHKVNKLVVFHI